MYGQKFGRKLVKTAQNREKKEWAREEPKLDNARRLRGIYFIDPDERNSQECEEKTGKTHGSNHALQKTRASRKWLQSRTVYPRRSPKQCTVEKWNPMNPRDNAQNLRCPKTMKITWQVKDYNLAHKFIPVPQAMKIPDAKAAVDKEWKSSRQFQHGNLMKSQEEEGGYSGSTKRQKESPLCCTDGHVSPQKCRVGTQMTEVLRQSRARGRHCERRLWSLCSKCLAQPCAIVSGWWIILP